MPWIITKKTAAETKSQSFGRGSVPNTVKLVGVVTSETVTINEVGEDGTLVTAYDEAGDALVLSLTRPSIGIYAPITLQFVKGVTANAVGIQVVE